MRCRSTISCSHSLREVQSLSGEVAGVVRLYANASAIVGFLPERLKAFQAHYPLVRIALTEQISDEVIRACMDDRADVGISASGKASGGLESWHFADDPLMVVLPLDHELAALEAPTFSDVLRFPLVALQAGGSLDLLIKERADAARTPLKLSVYRQQFRRAVPDGRSRTWHRYCADERRVRVRRIACVRAPAAR